MNAAFLENPGYDYCIFHDVDIFPVRGTPQTEPEHFGYHGMPNYFPIDQTRIIAKPAQKVAGCIFGVSNQVYQEVNIYSHSYWGWGYEDREFFVRLRRQGSRYGKPVDWVEEQIEGTFSFYGMPPKHHKHIKSTNMLRDSTKRSKGVARS